MPGQDYPVYRSKFPELGFYGLPGHTRAPRDILQQARDAEALGIGNLMISERADYKEIAAVCGACAAVTESINENIPVLYVGFGPKSLVNAGRIYDGVHLHTFMGGQALRQAVAQVRQGEREAGRAPGTVKVWSVLATACDASEERYLRLIVARLASYLQIPGYGEMLVAVNGWDDEVLDRFRADPIVCAMPGLIDSVASLEQIAAVEKLLPTSWRPAAVGDAKAKACAARWLDEFEAGADGIIVHASTPEEFAPVLREYEKVRPDGRFAERSNRPA